MPAIPAWWKARQGNCHKFEASLMCHIRRGFLIVFIPLLSNAPLYKCIQCFWEISMHTLGAVYVEQQAERMGENYFSNERRCSPNSKAVSFLPLLQIVVNFVNLPIKEWTGFRTASPPAFACKKSLSELKVATIFQFFSKDFLSGGRSILKWTKGSFRHPPYFSSSQVYYICRVFLFCTNIPGDC